MLSSRLDAGRLSVVDARAVCAALSPTPVPEPEAADDDDPGPEPDPDEDEDAWAFLYPDEPEPPGMGEATRDDAGVESGVLPALPLRRSAVGAHTTPLPFWPFAGASAMPCCMNGPDPSGAAPGRRLE